MISSIPRLSRIAGALAAVALVGAAVAAAAQPTLDEARAFVERAEAELLDLWIAAERANWVAATYITDDTEIIAAEAAKRSASAAVALAKQAARFDGLPLPPEVARKLELLKRSLTLPVPADQALAAELTRLVAGMEGDYSKAKVCPPGRECIDLQEISRRFAISRDPQELAELWAGWHATARPRRADFARYVELANRGAQELGYADAGALWRSKYDMPPDAFAAEVDRLWGQVKPLYDALHAYVRARLVARYGADVVPPDGPIPAHLLGNMWAQSWDNLYPLLAPKTSGTAVDVTALLRAKQVDELEMVRTGERFFTSLGFAPLPATFWQRSLFVKPRDREVICHASAWDIDWADDLRLKMCIEITAEDFRTVHHELGHNFYQRAYAGQSPLFRDSAHDGFHEAIGDTVALSVTPGYLTSIGLLEREPAGDTDVAELLQAALDKVAFLPFGVVIDQWRWQVFSGTVPPQRYNAAWWELIRRYQGVQPPVPRSEVDFDPGAKYHVPANVPYTRYFLADILQYQVHESLCDVAGYRGPLHRCSIYGNAAAGERVRKALAMGQSRPWPDVMEALTGQRAMDATAMAEYFAPLKRWLDEQNRGVPVGW